MSLETHKGATHQYEVDAWREAEQENGCSYIEVIDHTAETPDGWGVYMRPLTGGPCVHLEDFDTREEASAFARQTAADDLEDAA